MEKSNDLFKNTLLFAVGQFGSKIFVLLLVPLYTYAMSSEQFGVADLFQNTLNLVLPVFTCGMIETTMRFAMEKDITKEIVLKTAVLVVFGGFVILILFVPVLNNIKIFCGYALYLPFMFFISSLQSVFLQFARGINSIKLFIKGNILCSASLFASSFILIICLETGIHGYLISYIISNFISLIYLIFKGRLYKYFSFKIKDKETVKSMLKYGIPLVPNSLSWWVTLMSDRYFIVAYWSTSLNGLYSVAAKIPSAMGVLIGVFMQAWQLSAIKEYNQDNNSNFFDTVFQKYCAAAFTIGVIIISVSKIIAHVMFLNEFYEAWKYIPILMCAATISNVQKYFGAIYSAAMQTNKIFFTSMFGAIVNICMNFLLIPEYGANGAATATYISYICVFVYRVIDTKKYVAVNVKLKKCAILILLITIQSLLIIKDDVISNILSVLCAFISLTVNYKQLKELNLFLMKHIKNKLCSKYRKLNL